MAKIIIYALLVIELIIFLLAIGVSIKWRIENKNHREFIEKNKSALIEIYKYLLENKRN